jgi:hypothetical protein
VLSAGLSRQFGFVVDNTHNKDFEIGNAGQLLSPVGYDVDAVSTVSDGAWFAGLEELNRWDGRAELCIVLGMGYMMHTIRAREKPSGAKARRAGESFMVAINLEETTLRVSCNIGRFNYLAALSRMILHQYCMN